MSHSTTHSHLKKRTRPTHEHAEQASFGNLLQSALFGALLGMIASALLLFAATAICYSAEDPAAMTTPLSLAALYLSSLVAGFASVCRHRSSALLCGSLGGLLFMVVLLAVSCLLRGHAEDAFSTSSALLLRAMMLPVSAIGGFLGLPRQSAKRRRTHN